MVKIKNVFGDKKRGRQELGVYQGFYGMQVRRKYEGKKDANTTTQHLQRARFRAGIDFAKSLTKPERDFLKAYIRDTGITGLEGQETTWYAFAKKIAMTIPDVTFETEPGIGGFVEPYAPWTSRRPITITNTTTALTNYQVLITLTPTNFNYANARADGSDIRFTRADSTTPQPYWIETWNPGGTSHIWVRADSIPPGTNICLYIYHGNPAASSESNGDNVFDFFDNFPGTAIDTAKWTIVNGTGWSVANGELRGTNTTGRLISRATFSAPITQELRIRAITLPPHGATVASFFISSSDFFSLIPAPPHVGTWILGANPPYNIHIGVVFPDGNIPLLVRLSAFSTSARLTIIRLDTNVTTYDGTFTSPTSGESIMLGRRGNETFLWEAYDTYWDWIRIRQFASPEPTISIGTEERGTLAALILKDFTIHHPAIKSFEVIDTPFKEDNISNLENRIIRSIRRSNLNLTATQIKVITLANQIYNFTLN